jgi:hypothetical protein
VRQYAHTSEKKLVESRFLASIESLLIQSSEAVINASLEHRFSFTFPKK